MTQKERYRQALAEYCQKSVESTEMALLRYVDPDAWAEVANPMPKDQGPSEVTIKGVTYARIRYGEEPSNLPCYSPCHDCDVACGELHIPGCDWERCPACKGQGISCGCKWEGYDEE
jgi:hypothetical protein